jgi:lysophosphatidylcholine acyltransferase/lyso-PAF acetyltransferase
MQFYNNMEVRYLPVYYPSDEEKSNPKLFAKNVRQVMARALGVQTTEHAYEDVMLQGEVPSAPPLSSPA